MAFRSKKTLEKLDDSSFVPQPGPPLSKWQRSASRLIRHFVEEKDVCFRAGRARPYTADLRRKAAVQAWYLGVRVGALSDTMYQKSIPSELSKNRI